MIAHIKGRLVEKTPTCVIVETGGVGYYINISLNTFSKLPDDEACLLYTHFAVREDAQTLYGFADKEERKLFRYLISVSGVGPSTAQVVLSSMSPMETINAILSSNVGAIQQVKGIGSKTAQRIIVDLKDRITKDGSVFSDETTPLSPSNKTQEDALSALLMLGFAKSAAEKALSQVITKEGQDLSVEQLIKATLKSL